MYCTRTTSIHWLCKRIFGEKIGKRSNILHFADDSDILCQKNGHCLETKAGKILIKI